MALTNKLLALGSDVAANIMNFWELKTLFVLRCVDKSSRSLVEACAFPEVRLIYSWHVLAQPRPAGVLNFWETTFRRFSVAMVISSSKPDPENWRRHGGRIRRLSVSDCDSFSDAELAYCKNLRELHLHGQTWVLAKGGTHRMCAVTSAGVAQLAKLEVLFVDTAGISASAILSLPKLRVLKLGDSARFTFAAFKQLLARFPLVAVPGYHSCAWTVTEEKEYKRLLKKRTVAKLGCAASTPAGASYAVDGAAFTAT